jgi:LysM repeat protein
MSRSSTILIASFVALAAITYFLIPFSSDRDASDTLSFPTLHIDSASIVKIQIKQPTKNIIIENVGGRWMITSPVNAPADPIGVFAIVGGAAKLKIGSLISSNPEKQHIFQVDSSGTILTLKDRSGASTTLIVGKMGPSFSEIYFRLPDSKDVYLASGLDNWTVNKGVKEWRDKSIVRSSTEAIKEVSITNAGKNFNFKRDSSGWKMGDKVIDAPTINPLLTTLSNMQADDFVDSAIDLSGRPIIVNVKTFENIDLSIYPTTPDAAKYFIRTSKSPQIFLLSKWTVDQLLKPTGMATGIVPSTVTHAPVKLPPVEHKKVVEKPVIVEKPPVAQQKLPVKKETSTPPVVKEQVKENPVQPAPVVTKTVQPIENTEKKQDVVSDDEGDLTIHVVKAGETMTTIARKYGVTTERILKWNLLKSISVKPGQELYIYIKK